jgi:dUTP pyrophosphatase
MSIDLIGGVELRVKRLGRRAILPRYQTAGAACFDLHAVMPEHAQTVVYEGAPEIFSTGLAFEVPPGWVLKVYSRSGHGFNSDVRLANGVGVCDADYRGEVKVKLTADPQGELTVRHGDRIAQAMLERATPVAILEVDELSMTDRGAEGFGSTGAQQVFKANTGVAPGTIGSLKEPLS